MSSKRWYPPCIAALMAGAGLVVFALSAGCGSARAFEVDLAKIRAAYPAVQNVHARLTFAPKTLFVVVKPGTAWIDKWEASASSPSTATDTNQTTNEPSLDALLKKYAATRTSAPQDIGTGRFFALRFAQSLNTRVAAAEFAQSSSSLEAVYTDNMAGDGNNLYFKQDSSGTGKVYTFSLGYGDCPGGCFNRYDFSYTLHPNNSITQ